MLQLSGDILDLLYLIQFQFSKWTDMSSSSEKAETVRRRSIRKRKPPSAFNEETPNSSAGHCNYIKSGKKRKKKERKDDEEQPTCDFTSTGMRTCFCLNVLLIPYIHVHIEAVNSSNTTAKHSEERASFHERTQAFQAYGRSTMHWLLPRPPCHQWTELFGRQGFPVIQCCL